MWTLLFNSDSFMSGINLQMSSEGIEQISREYNIDIKFIEWVRIWSVLDKLYFDFMNSGRGNIFSDFEDSSELNSVSNVDMKELKPRKEKEED